MPPARPPPPPSTSSAAAADPCGGRAWPSSLRRERDPAKRLRGAVDGGTPLSDELLLLIFAVVSDLAGLVRCAATCRRWRRLVSAEAAFLCRTPRRSPGGFVTPLALGFFFHRPVGAAPRFVAIARASCRFPGLLRQPTLFDDALFDGSLRIVAARNGLLVIELRRATHGRALELCVCNPMTGEAHNLPPLGAKDVTGHYACTVLTAGDQNDKSSDVPPQPHSYFRLVMVYTRHGSTVFRSFSSDDSSWSEEAKVTSDRLSERYLSFTNSGVVHHGGKVVSWPAKNAVLVLSLDTLQLVVVNMPRFANTFLGLTPEGRLCAVQFNRLSLQTAVSIRVTICTDHGHWDEEESIQVGQSMPEDVTDMKLKSFCDKSGTVFFTAGCGESGHRRSEVYALSLKTRAVEKVANYDGANDPWGNLHGFEMDQVAYLASLAEPDSLEVAYLMLLLPGMKISISRGLRVAV